MKRVHLDEKETEEINNEVYTISKFKNPLQISVLKTLKHPNIVEYYESFVHKGKLCIVMDYAENGK